MTKCIHFAILMYTVTEIITDCCQFLYNKVLSLLVYAAMKEASIAEKDI